jgi:hypothetical protein
MYKNSFKKLLEKHIRAFVVQCDRMQLDRAEATWKLVNGTATDLLDFTADRIKIKEARENEQKVQQPTKTAQLVEEVSGPGEESAEPATAVQTTTKKQRKSTKSDKSTD